MEIAEYIGRDAARRWAERIRDRAALAAVTPAAGRKVPEIGRDDVRETFLRSYRIVYRKLGNAIVVVTVFEGARRFLVVNPDEPGE